MKRKVNKKQCEKCEKFFHPGVINKHQKCCGVRIKKSFTFSIEENWKQKNGKYKCPYCEKEYTKRGIATHIWRTHGEGKNYVFKEKAYKLGKKIAWNKGLTKETDERIKKSSETLSNNTKGKNNHWFGKHHTSETKEQIGDKLSRNNKGGRCKWYEVIKPSGEKETVQGTWERDFAKVLNILDENWIKPGVGNKNHTYIWFDKEGKKHNYTPDFYSPKLSKYFEVKGYWWGEDKLKMKYVLEQHKINVEIVQKKELQNYLKLIRGVSP